MQTLAILLDSVRLLRARKIFWVAAGISLLVAILYGSIGYDANGWSMMFGKWRFESEVVRAGSEYAPAHYLNFFASYVAAFWLSWGAVLLALVATSSVFPEFMAAGSIDVALSKPIGRVRLFFTKYVGCLLFVILLTLLLCVPCFLFVGIKVGEWKPEIFLAVPLVTAVYSFVFCIVVLLGVWTRSVLVALLAGLLFWFVIFLVQLTEKSLHAFKTDEMVEILEDSGMGDGMNQEAMRSLHGKVQFVQQLLPRTQETMALMKRSLTPKISAIDIQMQEWRVRAGGAPVPAELVASSKIEKAYDGLTPSSILIPSFVFEALVLLFACWIFCRRDY